MVKIKTLLEKPVKGIAHTAVQNKTIRNLILKNALSKGTEDQKINL